MIMGKRRFTEKITLNTGTYAPTQLVIQVDLVVNGDVR